MNTVLDHFAALYNVIVTVMWFVPLILLYVTVFVCTFGSAVWLMIIVPPWSSVIHPMLGQVTIVDQDSTYMFCIRAIGLIVAFRFLHLDIERFVATRDRIVRRSMLIQLVGMLVAVPQFLFAYMF